MSRPHEQSQHLVFSETARTLFQLEQEAQCWRDSVTLTALNPYEAYAVPCPKCDVTVLSALTPSPSLTSPPPPPPPPRVVHVYGRVWLEAWIEFCGAAWDPLSHTTLPAPLIAELHETATRNGRHALLAALTTTTTTTATSCEGRVTRARRALLQRFFETRLTHTLSTMTNVVAYVMPVALNATWGRMCFAWMPDIATSLGALLHLDAGCALRAAHAVLAAADSMSDDSPLTAPLISFLRVVARDVVHGLMCTHTSLPLPPDMAWWECNDADDDGGDASSSSSSVTRRVRVLQPRPWTHTGDHTSTLVALELARASPSPQTTTAGSGSACATAAAAPTASTKDTASCVIPAALPPLPPPTLTFCHGTLCACIPCDRAAAACSCTESVVADGRDHAVCVPPQHLARAYAIAHRLDNSMLILHTSAIVNATHSSAFTQSSEREGSSSSSSSSSIEQPTATGATDMNVDVSPSSSNSSTPSMHPQFRQSTSSSGTESWDEEHGDLHDDDADDTRMH